MIFNSSLATENADIFRDFLQGVDLGTEDEEKAYYEVLEELNKFLEEDKNDS